MTTVLVVEEPTAGRELLHQLLSRGGHDVVEADGESQALDLARRQSPQVVIADARSPRVDGGALLRLLREDPVTAGIPVVLYNASPDEPELRAVAEAYRVDRLVPRTPDPGPLLAAVDALIAETSGSGSGMSGSPTTGSGMSGSPTTGSGMSRSGSAPAIGSEGQWFRQVMDAAPVGVVTGRPDGEATYVNRALERISGLPTRALLGNGWLAYLGPVGRRRVDDALAAPPTGDDLVRHRQRIDRPDRAPQWLDVGIRHLTDPLGKPEGFVAFVTEVTAAQGDQQAEEEQQRYAHAADGDRAASRVDDLRRFAGSVAHGYNNALAIVLSYGEFLRDRIGDARAHGRLDQATAHDLSTDLDAIVAAGRRAAYLTQQLQSFGHRGQPPTPTVVDLNVGLAPELDQLRRRLAAGVTIEVALADGLPPVVADREQLGQALRNLVDNACDAMPSGGQLRVETATASMPGAGTTSIPGAGTTSVPGAEPGGIGAAEEYVRLTVRDTGHGMPSNVAQHALEPFFSTKPEARGGGLGLTAVAGMAHQAGGDVLIESGPDGTSVHVLFPVAAPTAAPPPEPVDEGAGLAETVIVVDDEEAVRRLVHRILTKAGYQVLTAADANDAMSLVRSHAGPVHCLITDLAMPGIPGSELTRRLRAERPDLAVLFMSGYAEPLLHHIGNADNRTNLLPKPFSRVELLTAVRATIHEHRAGRPHAL